MPSERSSATRTDDLSSNASRANRSQGRGTNCPDHDDSVSGRDDDEPGIAPGAQSSSFPELMNIGQSEVRDSQGAVEPNLTIQKQIHVNLMIHCGCIAISIYFMPAILELKLCSLLLLSSLG